MCIIYCYSLIFYWLSSENICSGIFFLNVEDQTCLSVTYIITIFNICVSTETIIHPSRINWFNGEKFSNYIAGTTSMTDEVIPNLVSEVVWSTWTCVGVLSPTQFLKTSHCGQAQEDQVCSSFRLSAFCHRADQVSAEPVLRFGADTSHAMQKRKSRASWSLFHLLINVIPNNDIWKTIKWICLNVYLCIGHGSISWSGKGDGFWAELLAEMLPKKITKQKLMSKGLT